MPEAKEAIIQKHEHFMEHRLERGIPLQCWVCSTTMLGRDYIVSDHISDLFPNNFRSSCRLCKNCENKINNNKRTYKNYPSELTDTYIKDCIPFETVQFENNGNDVVLENQMNVAKAFVLLNKNM